MLAFDAAGNGSDALERGERGRNRGAAGRARRRLRLRRGERHDAPPTAPATNTGTVSGATWTIGRFGNALSFDGMNDWVTVPDAASLDLTSGMTLEAWVLPTALGAAWRTAIIKEGSGELRLRAVREHGDEPSERARRHGRHRPRPPRPGGASARRVGASRGTYDGTNLRLYVDGNLVGTQAATGSISVSTGVLRIGGNNVWPGEFFQGRIDEVRVYNRALTQGQIQIDMVVPVATDTRNPTVTA